MLKDLGHTWTVVSGRLLSPFYIALSLISRGVDPFEMRVPAAFCGTLAITLTIPLLKRQYPWRTGLIACVLIATLPMHIFYSRIAWELCVGPIAGIFLWRSLYRRAGGEACSALPRQRLSIQAISTLLRYSFRWYSFTFTKQKDFQK